MSSVVTIDKTTVTTVTVVDDSSQTTARSAKRSGSKGGELTVQSSVDLEPQHWVSLACSPLLQHARVLLEALAPSGVNLEGV